MDSQKFGGPRPCRSRCRRPARSAVQSACSPMCDCAVSFQRPRRSVLSWVLWDLAVGPVWVKTAFDTFASSAAFENGSAWMALTHGGSQDPCRAHEQSAQTGDDAIRGSKV